MKLLSTIVALALAIRVDSFAAIDPVDPVVDPGPQCVDGFLEGVTRVPPSGREGAYPPDSLVYPPVPAPPDSLCFGVSCRAGGCCPLNGECAEKIPC